MKFFYVFHRVLIRFAERYSSLLMLGWNTRTKFPGRNIGAKTLRMSNTNPLSHEELLMLYGRRV